MNDLVRWRKRFAGEYVSEDGVFELMRDMGAWWLERDGMTVLPRYGEAHPIHHQAFARKRDAQRAAHELASLGRRSRR